MRKILDLVLIGKWYDMIDSGNKFEEYREMKPYWIERFKRNRYTHVRFRRGYTRKSMLFVINRLTEGFGHPEWGAPESRVFIIDIGKRIQ